MFEREQWPLLSNQTSFLFFSDEDKNRRKENTAQPRRGLIEWSRKKRAFDLNSGSSLVRSMFCCASGGPYRWTPQEANKWFLTHGMRRHFRVVLVRVDHALAFTKNTAGSSGQERMHVSRLAGVRSFSSAERLAINTGLSHVILRLSPPSTPSILSLLPACRCRERTATVVLARRKACGNMLTWRDGLAKTFELQTCATQRKLRHRAMPTGGAKIDSGENCFPLKVANQLASYFYTSPGPIRIVVSKQPS